MSQNIIVEPTEDLSEELASDAEHQDEEAQEPTTAQATGEDEDTSIPEKYRGKSILEIVEMHQNAEKLIGRQANEVGTYRELLASLAEVKRTTDLSKEDTTDKPVEVTYDNLIDNPSETIRKVVESAIDKKLKPLQDSSAQSRLQQEVQQLMSEHPDAEQIGADPAFNEWVARSPYRLQDAQSWVENKDVNAARRLLSDFKEMHGIMSKQKQTEAPAQKPGIEAARKVATESGRNSSGDNRQKKTLSKREVMKVFINDRDRYESDSFQKMLMTHARNGTLVD